MKVNDVYRYAADNFPAQSDSWQRLCIIRRIDNHTVTFSIAANEQPKLSSGVVTFNESTFTMFKTDFVEFMEPIKKGAAIC